MRESLLQHLKQVSPEEQSYREGNTQIIKELYANSGLGEVDKNCLLKQGNLVTVRAHSRFVNFPKHRHNFIEIMYVAEGSITHLIEGQELVMTKGDILLMNQQVEHSVRKASYDDIGINFIALPEFFEIPLKMLKKENVLAEFIVGTLRQKEKLAHYMLFHLQGVHAVENLMENMIESMIFDEQDEALQNQYSMGLVFLYLLEHLEHLSRKSTMNYKEMQLQTVLQYIQTDYKDANLTKIAEDLHQSVSVLSKKIKTETGYNFQELLQRRRFGQAVKFLVETDLPVEEIAVLVGYENLSYFYRQFQKRYHMTPRNYRIEHRGDAVIHI